MSLAGYLATFVHRLLGSSKSIGGIISSIKRDCELRKVAYLDASDQLILLDLVKELRYEDNIAIRRVKPLTRHILDAVYGKRSLRGWRSRLVMTMMTVAHDALLRSGELCGYLRPTSLSWNMSRSRVTINLWRTKCYRFGNGQLITLVDYGKRSGCALLRRWMRRMGMSDQSDCYLFPRWDDRKRAFDFTKCTTTDKFRKYIKESVRMVRLNPADYSGHSPRAGGATDLFIQKVPLAVVKKFGRWLSDAVLLYFRDEEDIADQVAAAFANVVKKPSRGDLPKSIR